MELYSRDSVEVLAVKDEPGDNYLLSSVSKPCPPNPDMNDRSFWFSNDEFAKTGVEEDFEQIYTFPLRSDSGQEHQVSVSREFLQRKGLSCKLPSWERYRNSYKSINRVRPTILKKKPRNKNSSPTLKTSRRISWHVHGGNRISLSTLQGSHNQRHIKVFTPANMKRTVKGSDTIVASLMHGARNVPVVASSVKSLHPSTYINDEILDYGLLMTLKSITNLQNVVFCPMFFWKSYVFRPVECPLEDKRAKTMLKLMGMKEDRSLCNFLKLEYIIIPANRDNHWMLIIVYRPFPSETSVNKVINEARTGSRTQAERLASDAYTVWGEGERGDIPTIMIFDSLGARMQQDTMNYDQFHEDIVGYVRRWLATAHKKYWNILGCLELETAVTVDQLAYTSVPVLGQNNKSDCGIYCMAYTKLWFQLVRSLNLSFSEAMDFMRGNQDILCREKVASLRKQLFDCIFEDCQYNVPEYSSFLTWPAETTVATIKEEPVDENLQYHPTSSVPFSCANVNMMIEQFHNMCHSQNGSNNM